MSGNGDGKGVVVSKRVRQVNSKFKDYIGGRPAGSCPGCNAYVTGNAVVCNTCNAYWHFDCANTNAEEVKKLGDSEFYCEKHRLPVLAASEKGRMEHLHNNSSVKENVVKFGVSKFALNMEKHNKESLKNLNCENVFKRKDKGNQFTIHLNTASYFIIVKSIATLGGRYGMTVKRIDVDKKGNGTKDQYDVTVNVGQVNVTMTMICYHTNNNIQVQLKGSQVEKTWGLKVQAFEWFVDGILREMINKVKTHKDFGAIKEEIRKMLTDRISNSTYCNLSTQIDEIDSITNGITESVVMQLKSVESGETSEDATENISMSSLSNRVETSAQISEEELASIVEVGDNSQLGVVSVSSREIEPDNDIISTENMKSGVESTVQVGDDSQLGVVSVIAVDRKDTQRDMMTLDDRESMKASHYETVSSSSNNVPSSIPTVGFPVQQTIAGEGDDKLVIVRKNCNEMQKNKLIEAVGVLKKTVNTEETIRNLFNIMLRLKNKSVELRSEVNFIYQPDLFDQVNRMTVQLVDKQKEVEASKKSVKELELQVKDLKRINREKEHKIKEGIKSEDKKNLMINSLNSDNEELELKLHKYENMDHVKEIEEGKKTISQYLSKISELETDIKDKDDLVSQLEKDNCELVKRCKSLLACEAELSSRIELLQAVSGHVGEENNSELVVIKEKNREETKLLQEDIKSLNVKIEKLSKSNSLLKDEVAVKSESLKKIDNFYKDIIDQKDQTLSALLNITEANSESEIKLRRLLVKFKSDQELKFVIDLKTEIEEKSKNSAVDIPKDSFEENRRMDDISNNVEILGGDGGVEGNDVNERVHNDSRQDPKLKKRLCKFGRTCTNKDTCSYSHEPINKACRFGDRCTKMSACLFGHRDQQQCDGPRNHVNWGEHEDASAQSYERNAWNRGNGFQIPEWNVWNRDNVSYRHDQNSIQRPNQLRGGQIGSRTKLCKDGTKCTNGGCTFNHEMIRKACKFGADCTRMDRCLFQHNENSRRTTSGVDMNIWLKNSKNGDGRA